MPLAPYAYVSQDRAIRCHLHLWQYIFTVCLTSKEILSVRLEYFTFELFFLAMAHKKKLVKKNEAYTTLKNLFSHLTEI